MKSRNPGTNRSQVLALTLFLVALIASCQRGETASQSETVITFEGTIEKLAPNPDFVSGIIAVYTLAKYRVERVCKGTYDKSEIVVDHLVFDRKEFEGFNLGDRVCVTAKISNKVHTRYNEEGIRDTSETITTFYVASDRITRADESGRCCAPAR